MDQMSKVVYVQMTIFVENSHLVLLRLLESY